MTLVLYAALLAVEAFAALLISQYDSSHGSRPRSTWPTTAEAKILPSSSMDIPVKTNQILEIIDQNIIDPSPTLFSAAVFVFALTALYAHHLNRRHRFQNHFTIVGICFGVMVSSTKNLINPNRPPTADLRKIVPWSFMIASLSSVVAHWWIGGAMIRDEDEDKHVVEVDACSQTRNSGSKIPEKGNLVDL